MGSLNPDYWGKPIRKPKLLKLTLKCKSLNDTKNMRMVLSETLKEYKFKKVDFSFEIEEDIGVEK